MSGQTDLGTASMISGLHEPGTSRSDLDCSETVTFLTDLLRKNSHYITPLLFYTT